MSKRKEKISALLDNAINTDELMSFSLSSEADDAKIAQRYQMVGDLLRKDYNPVVYTDISQAVSAVIAKEDSLQKDSLQNIAELNKIKPSHLATKLVPKKGVDTATSSILNWFKPAMGLAIAASVAMIMISSFNNIEQQDTTPIASNLLQQNSAAIPTNTAQKQQNKVLPVAQNQNTQTINVTPYINQHLEHIQPETPFSRMPYVRAVSFEPENN